MDNGNRKWRPTTLRNVEMWEESKKQLRRDERIANAIKGIIGAMCFLFIIALALMAIKLMIVVNMQNAG